MYEAPVLHTVDVAFAVLAYWFSSAKETGTDSKLLARTFDLSSAYRQVGLSRQGREVSYIRVYNPDEDCMMVFQALVLPFGVKECALFLTPGPGDLVVGSSGLQTTLRRLHPPPVHHLHVMPSPQPKIGHDQKE